MKYKIYLEEEYNDFNGDQDLIDELSNRGYTVSKDPVPESFEREDWHFLLEMLDKNPQTWYTLRVRDKLLEACYG